jgi:hypothetical protein
MSLVIINPFILFFIMLIPLSTGFCIKSKLENSNNYSIEEWSKIGEQNKNPVRKRWWCCC